MGLLLMAVALVLAGSWRELPSQLAAALACVAAGVLVLWLVGGFAAGLWLHSVVGARMVWATCGLTVAVLAVRRLRPPDPVTGSGLPGAWTLLAFAPAFFAAVVGLGGALRSVGGWSSWFLAGDHSRHLVLVADVWDRAALDYGPEPYPQGWHALLATAWGVTDPGIEAQGFAGLVDLMALASWFTMVILSFAAGTLAMSIGRVLDLRVAWLAAAGFGGSASVWLPTLAGAALARGFETAAVGTVLVAAGLHEVVRPGSWGRALVINALAAALLAHVWHLLLPALLVPLATATLLYVRQGDRARRALAVTATCLAAAAISLPGLWAVVERVGIDQAGSGGDVRSVSLLWMFPGCAVPLWLAARYRHRATFEHASAVSALVIVGLSVVVVVSVPLTAYYPAKVLWSATVLGLPGVAALVPRLLAEMCSAHGLHRILFAPTAALATLVAAIGAASPALGPAGRWSTVRQGELVLDAVTAPGAARAQVVWTGVSHADDGVARALLYFYRVADRDGLPPFSGVGLDAECRILREASLPTVLSPRPAAEVGQRYLCAGPVQVVPVPATVDSEAASSTS
jgi:hypothetical protein